MSTPQDQRTAADLVFVGLSGNVIALDRVDGSIVWEWRPPKVGYLTLLLDGDRLVVSSNGYLYCLDPTTGAPLWQNPLTGKGIGIACLTSVRGSSDDTAAATAAIAAAASSRSANAGHFGGA